MELRDIGVKEYLALPDFVKGDLEVAKRFVMGICRIFQLEYGTRTKLSCISTRQSFLLLQGRIKKVDTILTCSRYPVCMY